MLKMYPQMILCFSVWLLSQLGHLYCTNSISHPNALAIVGTVRRGDEPVLRISIISIFTLIAIGGPEGRENELYVRFNILTIAIATSQQST